MDQQPGHGDGRTLVCAELGGGRASLVSVSFNFINSIIGSGIIGLPYAMNQAGLPLGLLLLVGVAVITDYSIILLIKGGNMSATSSYQALVRSALGRPGFLLVSLLQFLYPFIAMVSYNMTVGDTLTKVFQRIPGVGPDHMLAERSVVISMATVLVTLPLSLPRHIGQLGKVSLLSMVLTLAILLVVAVRAATLGPLIPPTEDAWVFAKLNAIQAVGVLSFAFICHHNSFLMYHSLQRPTLSAWLRVTHVSVGTAAAASAAFAVAGYTTFTGHTQGDIFENYCREDDLVTFGRFCFGLSIMTTFPLECFVTREVLSNVFYQRELSSLEHVALTLLLVASSCTLSLLYDCLGWVMELNGVLSAIPLIFILPSACFLKLSPGRWFHSEKLLPSLLLLAGGVLVLSGLVLSGLFPHSCTHGDEPSYCNASRTAPPG
ncbi:putative sodium-coupled neutral amino acid transporter 11 [Gadus morhua]|uniref:Putative sodium-coupled neutral amino acid transporter 11 n=1 Tax=Gadus morhua TaxID=8049 RepID=A0A8C5B0Z1_GADMO|nr:putative sodium-coupled neutral amino acid transporter 11 [Gadus morhua]